MEHDGKRFHVSIMKVEKVDKRLRVTMDVAPDIQTLEEVS